MGPYVVRRILAGIVVLFGVTLITFMLPQLSHTTVTKSLLGQHVTRSEMRLFNHRHGYDQSIFVQYWRYMVGLFHGNFGTSLDPNNAGVPVSSLVSVAMWRTLWLAIVSLAISVTIAIPVGLLQAVKRNSTFDYVATGVVFFVYSIPAFLLGILLIVIFSLNLHWVPTSITPPSNTGIFDPLIYMFQNPRQFILPCTVLVFLTVGGFTRFMRGSVLDTLVQDYIRTARAKGANSRRVLYKHAFRNAILPVITLLGLALPGLFAGAIITETLFNYEGMGLLTVSATQSYDVATVMAITLVVAVATLIGNFLADIGIAVVDPRIRLTGKR